MPRDGVADPGVPRARAAVARAHLGPVGVREHGEAHERADALERGSETC